MELKGNKTESIAMFEKKQREKRFHKDVGSHVGSRYPICLERAFRNVITNEMVVDINMFRMRGYHFRFNKGKGALVVTEKRERLWNWQSMDGEE